MSIILINGTFSLKRGKDTKEAKKQREKDRTRLGDEETKTQRD